MAAFRKRKNRWDVQIRRPGYPAICNTVFHKTDAQKWAMEIERQIEVGDYVAADLLHLDTLGALLAHYSAEISIKKRGRVEEISRSAKMRRHKISALPLGKLKPFHIAQYRDERLQEVSTTTAKKELQLISHALDIGRREWGLNIKNVAADVAKPKEPKGRERRLEEDEEHLLLGVLSASENHWIKPLMEFAIETGMRRGELLALRWKDIDLAEKMAGLRMTKNGSPRQVPLTPKAIALLGTNPRTSHRVFNVSSVALRMAWDRLLIRTDITNLHFHDLRHEAISRFFEMGLSVPEVALISGHKTPSQLFRYTNLRPRDLVQKLSTLTQ